MITVLVATYQGAAYVREQLDSILNQTVSPSRILVSDDGSDDGTWDIIAEYMKQYPKQVRGIRHEKKRGGLNPAASNFFGLLSQAEGDYILLSDQDDVWEPNKIECLQAAMTKAETQLGKGIPLLLYSDACVVDQELNEIAPSFMKYQSIHQNRTLLSQILVENPVTGGAVMMNHALLDYVRQAPIQCMMHDWWIALAASCFGKIYYVDMPLYQYRQHGSNTLGARKTGGTEDLQRRVKQSAQVKENYNQMFGQAICFRDQFRDELSEEQMEVLQAFISLKDKGKIRKLGTIFHYRFYKSSWMQTLAQCLTMPGK